LEKVKEDQYRRIDELQKHEESFNYKAQLIEINLEDVDKAITIIRSAVANALDWNQLWKLVKEEKKRGDPIASMIHRLKLDTNEV
jgi:hypothetical protein